MKGTVKLAAGLVTELPSLAGFNAIADLQKSSYDLLEQFTDLSWDPIKEMPVLPETTPNGFFADEQYAAACYHWYLDGQNHLSDGLIIWSPARWEAIYLENVKQYRPSESRLDIFVKMLL